MTMQNPKSSIEAMEDQFLDLAAEAVKSASWQARKSGRRIVVSSSTEPQIVELSPNGEIRVIKQIDPPLRIPAGTVVQIP